MAIQAADIRDFGPHDRAQLPPARMRALVTDASWLLLQILVVNLVRGLVGASLIILVGLALNFGMAG